MASALQTPTVVPDNLVDFANRVGTKVATLCMISFATILAAAPAMANYSSLIMDATTGRVLHETNADLIRYPASLTKMMTLYLLFQALDNRTVAFDERLPISEHAAAQPPSKLGLMPGQSISVENAILALVTKSANDVAAAVAERLGGVESRFAWLMTAKAREIGMSRTMFANASGLPDPYQVTTARDVAVLALALLHDFPHYYHYFGTDRFYYGGAIYANHNRLLGSYEGLDGIKTGYTQSAGFNLVASAVRDGRRLIGVVLGAGSPAKRSLIMVSLLDQAFDGHGIIEVQDEEPAPPVQVRLARVDSEEGEARRDRAEDACQGEVAIRHGGPRFEGVAVPRIRRDGIRACSRQSGDGKKARSRVPFMIAQVGPSGIQQPVGVRSRSESRLVAAKPVPKAQGLSRAKAVVAAAKSSSQLKTTAGAGSKASARRIVKASSTPDKSKLRVAEGERRRSS